MHQRDEEMRNWKEKSCVLEWGFGLSRKGSRKQKGGLINWEVVKDSRGWMSLYVPSMSNRE